MNICKQCGGDCGPDKKGRKRQFCSRICVGTAIGRRRASRGQLINRTCPNCGVPVVKYVSRMGRGFCSKKCAREFRKRDFVMSMGFSRSCVDKNQKEIVAAFRKMGASVADFSRVGAGVPDLLVAYAGKNELVEIKNLEGQYGRKGLNENQKKWAAAWRGSPVRIVTNVDDAIALLKIMAL